MQAITAMLEADPARLQSIESLAAQLGLTRFQARRAFKRWTEEMAELAGARRALLSPIRFATREPYAIPSTLGLANSKGHQELVVYVLHPDKRFEVKNYRENGIWVGKSKDLVFRDLIVDKAGKYGVFPQESENILIENNEASRSQIDSTRSSVAPASSARVAAA